MKKRFLLPLSLLFITIFGLVGCSNFLSLKTKVTMNFNGQELYRAVKARSADDFIIDSAELEVKLFVDDKEFSKQTITITEKSSKNLSVKFSDIKLDSVVYAEAKITIKNPDNKPETVLYGKSDSKTLTDYFVEISIVLKWADDDSKYDPANTPIIPDGQPDSFTLKYNIYKYEQKTDVDNPANYELYKSYSFTVNYKDFKNFSDFTCVDLIIKTTEMSFDMCLAGYEENYTLEDGDEPQIINGEATLNSYWYKTGTPITPTILVQKADIAKYQLKLYNGDDKIYIIEDDNGNRLAMGSWMINMTSIEPEKYGIYLGQALTYNDGIPKLSFDIGNTQPYTPELNDISTDGLTIKNLIGDTETTITFETSGLDVQALMSGTSPDPQVDSIVISIDCEDEMYAAEDTIKISAKYSKQNINVPLDKIYTEIYMGLIPTQPGVMPIEYEIYPNKDPNMPSEWAKDSYFNVTTNENTLILTPDFPDGFIFENNSDVTQLFYITVEANDGTITETDNKPITILSGTRPDAVISMSPDPSKNNIPEGSVVTITAVKQDGTNVSADYISVQKIEQRVTDKNGTSFNEIPTTSYSVDNEDTYTKAITLSGLSDGNSYRITIVVDDGNELYEEKQFNVSITTPITQININGRTPSEMTSAITEVLTNVYNSRSKLHLKFTGENDATGYNLYSEVMEIANSKGFSPYSEIIYNDENEYNPYNSGIFTLDYSECGGAVVDSIPDETYQKAVILYSLKISPDTTKIGSKAFAGENSNVLGVSLQDLDLKNVNEVGEYAFMWARIIGTLNMPKVTKLGDSAFDNFIGGTVNLDNLVKIDKLEEDGYGDNVFRYAEINDTFYAPKLEVLRGATFYDGKIYQIPDSLVIVDNNSLHFRNIYNVAFESDAGKQGWYQITGTYQGYTSDELMTLLYEHPENWDAVLAETGVLTPIDPSDVISSFQNQGRDFIRRK